MTPPEAKTYLLSVQFIPGRDALVKGDRDPEEDRRIRLAALICQAAGGFHSILVPPVPDHLKTPIED